MRCEPRGERTRTNVCDSTTVRAMADYDDEAEEAVAPQQMNLPAGVEPMVERRSSVECWGLTKTGGRCGNSTKTVFCGRRHVRDWLSLTDEARAALNAWAATPASVDIAANDAYHLQFKTAKRCEEQTRASQKPDSAQGGGGATGSRGWAQRDTGSGRHRCCSAERGAPDRGGCGSAGCGCVGAEVCVVQP
jgi:hypothetical protein